MFSQRIQILYGIKYLKWPNTFFLIARGSHDHVVIVKRSFLQNTKLLVLLEIQFGSDQLLSKNLESITRSLGYPGCQSLLNYGVKVVKLKLLGCFKQIITAFLEFLISKKKIF